MRKFKKRYHTTTVSSPPMRQTKNNSDQTGQKQKRKMMNRTPNPCLKYQWKGYKSFDTRVYTWYKVLHFNFKKKRDIEVVLQLIKLKAEYLPAKTLMI